MDRTYRDRAVWPQKTCKSDTAINGSVSQILTAQNQSNSSIYVPSSLFGNILLDLSYFEAILLLGSEKNGPNSGTREV